MIQHCVPEFNFPSKDKITRNDGMRDKRGQKISRTEEGGQKMCGLNFRVFILKHCWVQLHRMHEDKQRVKKKS